LQSPIILSSPLEYKLKFTGIGLPTFKLSLQFPQITGNDFLQARVHFPFQHQTDEIAVALELVVYKQRRLMRNELVLPQKLKQPDSTMLYLLNKLTVTVWPHLLVSAAQPQSRLNTFICAPRQPYFGLPLQFLQYITDLHQQSFSLLVDKVAESFGFFFEQIKYGGFVAHQDKVFE
jgi:hypothetical protein